MHKSYGEIAYNAYCKDAGWKSLVSGAVLPAWDRLDYSIQDEWNAAAQAVVKQQYEDTKVG